MLRRALKDSAIYGLSGLLARGIGLLLLPLYTRALSPTEYGRVDLLLVVRSLVAVTLSLEIGQALVRFLVEARDDDGRRELASTALWFTAGAYLLFGAAAMAWSRPLSAWLLDTPTQAGVVRVAALYMGIAGVFQLMQDLLRFDLRARAYAAASIVSAVAAAATTAGLVLGVRMGVAGVFWGLIAGSLAGAAYSWHAGRQRYGMLFRWARCREMLAFSAPLVASSIAGMVALFIDRIAIRALMTVGDVGVYGVAARFASIAALVVSVLQTALLPLIYNHHAEERTPGEIARILRVVVLVLAPAVTALGVFAPEIVGMITTPRYLAAAPVIPLLAAGVVLAQFWTFAPGLGLGKRTRTIAALNIGAAALNTVLNFVLIPRMGIMGAALATLVSAAGAAVAYQVLGGRIYPVPHRWPRLLAVAGVAAAGLALARAWWGAAPVVHPAEWIGKGALCLAASLLIAALLVERDEARRLGTLLVRRPTPA